MEINKKTDTAPVSLPDTLLEFMDAPRDISKEEFLKKYGAEKVFRLKGYNKEKGGWLLNNSGRHNNIWSECVYFTYEDAISALMMKNVTYHINRWIVKQNTVKQMIEKLWTIRFVRNDGKILVAAQNGDRMSITIYTQKELLDQLVLKYNEKAVVFDKQYMNAEEICLDDIVLWTLAGPDLTKERGSWSLRSLSKYEKAGPYYGESCVHSFSTYEEAVKKARDGFYPQKTILYHELSLSIKGHAVLRVLHCGDKEILFVPKEMADAKAIVSDVKDNVENIRMENDIVSYLKESGVSEENIKRSVEKMKKNEDVFMAFHSYIMSMEYPETPVIGGYSPKSLHEEVGDRLSPVGIMNYLIYLQEDPEAALRSLKEGLPKK